MVRQPTPPSVTAPAIWLAICAPVAKPLYTPSVSLPDPVINTPSRATIKDVVFGLRRAGYPMAGPGGWTDNQLTDIIDNHPDIGDVKQVYVQGGAIWLDVKGISQPGYTPINSLSHMLTYLRRCGAPT